MTNLSGKEKTIFVAQKRSRLPIIPNNLTSVGLWLQKSIKYSWKSYGWAQFGKLMFFASYQRIVSLCQTLQLQISPKILVQMCAFVKKKLI